MKFWILSIGLLLSCAVFAQAPQMSSPASLQERIAIIKVEKERLAKLIHSYGVQEETRNSQIFRRGCDEDDKDHDDGPTTSPNCMYRAPDGVCGVYGADICN